MRSRHAGILSGETLLRKRPSSGAKGAVRNLNFTPKEPNNRSDTLKCIRYFTRGEKLQSDDLVAANARMWKEKIDEGRREAVGMLHSYAR